MITMSSDGKKYRGCHKDCEGCVYQVKAMVGRQHGCNLCWEGNYDKCPINGYWVGFPELSEIVYKWVSTD